MNRPSGLSLVDNLALAGGKLSALAIRSLGLGLASNLPGRISGRISSRVLSLLAGQARRGILAVTGTNGKSTSSGLVASILQQENLRIVHNKQGANLLPGLTSCLIDAAGWTGRIDADYCLFEIDEAALPVVAKELNIEAVLVTNLFRDQLDRFGELDTTAKLISKGILSNKSLSVLNADDPNVAQMVPDCRRIFYGIQTLSDSQESAPSAGFAELSYCPKCGKEYDYSLRFYGQVGHYFCGGCGHNRPEPEIYAEGTIVEAWSSKFRLMYGKDALDINLPLPGLFNVYNALAAAALCYSVGISANAVKEGLCRYSTLFGRSERIQYKDKTILIQLIKNPAGASQAVQAVSADSAAQVLIAINDNYADGRDISWLWDAEFEALNSCGGPFLVSGQRCHDMAVRLKYAGIDEAAIGVEPELEKALERAVERLPVGGTLWLLPTYTCLLELQKIMRARGCRLAGT